MGTGATLTIALIYLWAPDEPTAVRHDADERRCRDYAGRHGWLVGRLIREVGGEASDPYRDGLTRVYEALHERRADALLIPDQATIGDEATFQAVAEIVEGPACQAFIQIVK